MPFVPPSPGSSFSRISRSPLASRPPAYFPDPDTPTVGELWRRPDDVAVVDAGPPRCEPDRNTPALLGNAGVCLGLVKGHAARVRAVAVVGTQVWSGSLASSVLVHEAATGKLVGSLSCSAGSERAQAARRAAVPAESQGAPLDEHVSALLAVGDTVWIGFSSGRLGVWNAKSGLEMEELAGPSSDAHAEITALALVANTVWIASADGGIAVWDARGRVCNTVLSGHTNGVRALLCVTVPALQGLPQVAVWSASDDNTIRMWDPQSGETRHILDAHTGAVLALAADDAGRVWSGGADKSILVWNAASGKLEADITPSAAGWVTDLVWATPFMWAASTDRSVRIYSSTPVCLRICHGHGGWVTALTRVRNTVWSASSDTTLRIWTAAPDAELPRHSGQSPPRASLASAAGGPRTGFDVYAALASTLPQLDADYADTAAARAAAAVEQAEVGQNVEQRRSAARRLSPSRTRGPETDDATRDGAGTVAWEVDVNAFRSKRAQALAQARERERERALERRREHVREHEMEDGEGHDFEDGLVGGRKSEFDPTRTPGSARRSVTFAQYLESGGAASGMSSLGGSRLSHMSDDSLAELDAVSPLKKIHELHSKYEDQLAAEAAESPVVGGAVPHVPIPPFELTQANPGAAFGYSPAQTLNMPDLRVLSSPVRSDAFEVSDDEVEDERERDREGERERGREREPKRDQERGSEGHDAADADQGAFSGAGSPYPDTPGPRGVGGFELSSDGEDRREAGGSTSPQRRGPRLARRLARRGSRTPKGTHALPRQPQQDQADSPGRDEGSERGGRRRQWASPTQHYQALMEGRETTLSPLAAMNATLEEARAARSAREAAATEAADAAAIEREERRKELQARDAAQRDRDLEAALLASSRPRIAPSEDREEADGHHHRRAVDLQREVDAARVAARPARRALARARADGRMLDEVGVDGYVAMSDDGSSGERSLPPAAREAIAGVDDVHSSVRAGATSARVQITGLIEAIKRTMAANKSVLQGTERAMARAEASGEAARASVPPQDVLDLASEARLEQAELKAALRAVAVKFGDDIRAARTAKPASGSGGDGRLESPRDAAPATPAPASQAQLPPSRTVPDQFVAPFFSSLYGSRRSEER
ncbi:WD-40 repeat protein [Thecamonas trahens ATCC 50062]|uniref:WD-40 repeat protein n=1 Tax=Thecamonas trahens ATCC 50062 TaxID=461836 RepID=A0A0L0DJK2_THETB|nr:WD-40 repeat protein [Thecamonas trahens ATCC 50062]KNC52574.1 WD-40 repeat protein [Thecamonas trahens ATCC 50062]|eukprot:XP_013755363.1 WD-40 repeat protein [Thecamonas trahens ATCC 50062]